MRRPGPHHHRHSLCYFLGFKTWEPLLSTKNMTVLFKQQDNPRYTPAMQRYRPGRKYSGIILGSATPSLETLLDCRKGTLRPSAHATRATQVKPRIHILDTRQSNMNTGLSPCWLVCIITWTRGTRPLLFLNKRGYAPVVYCPFLRLDGNLPTMRHSSDLLSIHEYAALPPLRPAATKHPRCVRACKTSTLKPWEWYRGIRHTWPGFPDVRIIRFDRDAASTTTKLRKPSE